MKVVIGLGNPGWEYQNTRHNVGFMVIDRLASNLKIDSFEQKWNGLVANRLLKGEEIYLLKPMTYMNLSGKCIKSVIDATSVNFHDILVVLDDTELPLGTIRIRARGSSGGHNGLQSIIDECGTEDIPRLRIGIGRPPENVELAEYVLQPFGIEEKDLLEMIIDRAVDGILCWIFEGVENAMNKFNRSFLQDSSKTTNGKGSEDEQ